jgi:squalene-hopene/tetraprenyl-beta-curcumene cyclase
MRFSRLSSSLHRLCTVLLVSGLGLISSCTHHRDVPVDLHTWSPKAAATYLDQRERWWMNWPKSARGNSTFCVSCHTAVPYALARPALSRYLGQTGPTETEQALLDPVAARIRNWKTGQPFYTDQHDGVNKTAQSRGTEAVLNALVLASYGQGKPKVSNDTQTAFDIMWDEQITTGSSRGAWSWIQFDNQPWEAPDSEYYGAALAAVAIGLLPATLQSQSPYLDALREYLQRERAHQSLLNQAVVLWASARVTGLLTTEEKSALIRELMAKQQSDGGWNLPSLAWASDGWHRPDLLARWRREDGTWQTWSSDGYATALVVLALVDAGVSPDNNQARRGAAWLLANQNRDQGSWPSLSLNQHFKPSSDFALFMTDAATAYAVLALDRCDSLATFRSAGEPLVPFAAAGTDRARSRFIPEGVIVFSNPLWPSAGAIEVPNPNR